MTTSGITVFGQPSQPNHGAGGRIAMDDAVFPTDYVVLDLETTGFYPNSCAITEIGAVRVREVLPRFIAWLATPAAGPAVEPIVGHNVSFDLRFLDYNTRHIAGCGFACADYDTMQISRALFPAQRHHRLADLIVRFGIADNEEHRALSDAIQTQQCFEWMRHYVTEHHESEAIRWKQAPAKNSAEILHQQLVVKR